MRLRLSPRLFMVIIAAAGLVMVGLFLFFIRKQQEEAVVSSAGGLLLTGLAFLNVLLMTVLLFVLFRELVKGYLSWRRQREGARFRTRLLTSFVLLGLLPSILLFIGAILLIESTVDTWFQSPVHGLSTASQNLVDRAMDMARDESRRKASALAWQLGQVPKALRPSFMAHLFKGGDVDGFAVIDASGKVLAKAPQDFPAPDAYKTGKVFGPGGLVGWIDLSPKPTVVSGTPIDDDMGLVVGCTLPTQLFDQARYISENSRSYLQIRTRQRALKISMISTFLALTLLVTFAAVWVGSNLSREISIPLQLLLEGTEAVSRGDLTHRIPYSARDEFGMVVESFNVMTRELEVSKVELERSNVELQHATESSERARRYVETLVETLNIGIVSTTPDNQVRTLNSRARKIMGLQPEEPPRNLLTRPEWAPIAALLAQLPRRPVTNREVTLITRGGPIILSVSAEPLREPSGNVYGTLVILEDISDLSRAQRVAAWQEVAQRMAHEIKNPLTPIRLSAQRIRKKAAEGAEDLHQALEEGCTTIDREVQAMMAMVSEFSRFARLPEIHPKPGSLPALIHSSIVPYRQAAEFEVDIPAHFPPVRFDAEQMGRVMKNLLENAIQAMDPPGTIRIALREAEGQAVLTIRDTGPGISAENRPRLFAPYFSTKKKGTGLGLAIVARILEEHGGTIRIDDAYRDGAGLIITLPV